jgi:thiamine-phosphate pyrophosphorylase
MKKNNNPMYRIIDANANRAREGLRVAEEVVRFVTNKRSYTAQFKLLRHELKNAIESLPVSVTELLSARNSASDVGGDMVIFSKKRVDTEALFMSNLKRAQEAVRVLEEFSKVLSSSSSKKFQAIRFHLYEFEKKAYLKLFSK